MKKTYIAPGLEVVKIETASMIALSGYLDNNQSITDQNGFGARDFDFEEEEEY